MHVRAFDFGSFLLQFSHSLQQSCHYNHFAFSSPRGWDGSTQWHRSLHRRSVSHHRAYSVHGTFEWMWSHRLGIGSIFLHGCDQIFWCVHHDDLCGHVPDLGHLDSLLTGGDKGETHAANFTSGNGAQLGISSGIWHIQGKMKEPVSILCSHFLLPSLSTDSSTWRNSINEIVTTLDTFWMTSVTQNRKMIEMKKFYERKCAIIWKRPACLLFW